jgi:DNA-binding GntR family transcriptional regulator
MPKTITSRSLSQAHQDHERSRLVIVRLGLPLPQAIMRVSPFVIRRLAPSTYSGWVNKQERTYTILRDRIHSGSFAPMARLNIDALSRELGVSPIPVREALRRLEAEGWVRFTPNVGAVVSPLDSTTWEQAMVALAVLEGAASGEAQANLRRSDLTRLRKISANMEQPGVQADPFRFSELNRTLHAVIIARCPNAYLVDLLEQTNARLARLRSTMFVYLPHRSEESLREHLHLIELLEHGTKEEVENYARWHKLRTVEAYRAIHERNDKVMAAQRAKSAVRANASRRVPSPQGAPLPPNGY